MSTELLSVIVATATLLVAMFSGFGWIIHRSDARIDRLAERVDARFERIDTQFDRIERELGDVKIAIARIE